MLNPLIALHDALKDHIDKSPEEIWEAICKIKKWSGRTGLAGQLKPIAGMVTKTNNQIFDAGWLKLLSPENVGDIDFRVVEFLKKLAFPEEKLDGFLNSLRDHVRQLFVINLLVFDRRDGRFPNDGSVVKTIEINFLEEVTSKYTVELSINSEPILLAETLSKNLMDFIRNTRANNKNNLGIKKDYPKYLYGFTALAALFKVSCIKNGRYNNENNYYDFSETAPLCVETLTKKVKNSIKFHFDDPIANKMFHSIYYTHFETEKDVVNLKFVENMFNEWKNKLTATTGTKKMYATGHNNVEGFWSYVKDENSYSVVSDHTQENNKMFMLSEIASNMKLIIKLLSRKNRPGDRMRKGKGAEARIFHPLWDGMSSADRTLLHSEFCQNIAKWIGCAEIEVK